MFEEGLEEFDDSRQVVQDLIDEYEACETLDYLNFVSFFFYMHCSRAASFNCSGYRAKRTKWKNKSLFLFNKK